MREIKFRAWNANESYMVDSKVGVASIVKKSILEGNYQVGWFTEKMTEDNYILMQYIGIKDKNDKEIYEGDIIKIHRNSDAEGMYWMDEEIGQVEYTDGAFIYSRAWGKNKFIRPFMEICEFIGFKYLEVIGNIYENPELLEIKKIIGKDVVRLGEDDFF